MEYLKYQVEQYNNGGEEYDLTNKNFMMTNQRDMVRDFVYNNLGEDEEVADGIRNLVDGFDEVVRVLHNELIGDRYTSVKNWEELSEEILEDIRENPGMYDKEVWDPVKLVNALEQDLTEEFLTDIGWAIDRTNDVAFLFDDGVKLKTHDYDPRE